MTGDIGNSFDKLINFMFIKHDGLLIERCGDKYRWCGRLFDSLEDLDKFRSTPNPGLRVVTPGDGCEHSDQMIP